METHEPDPTTDEPTDPWESASSDFSQLTERLKATYRRLAPEGGPSEEEVKEAVATLVGAWDRVAASFSTALNDPDTRAQLKRAAASFAAAVGATITGLADEFKDRSTDSPGSSDQPVDQSGADSSVIDRDDESSPTTQGQH